MRNLSKINEGADVVTKDYVDSSVSGGTVTSVGVSNATNGGLTVSGSPVTGSGTITIGHSNVLSSAQTTQAVYPIKIDKNGHISAYGSAVTIPTVPSNIVNTITTTAGAHSAISNQKGNVSFNVPTKTSHLTNDSGFLTSHQDISGKVNKSGDTMTGNLIVPAERIANTYYGISFGRTTETPVETILYTGIKWIHGRHMPVVHVTGYAYGLNSPVEFKIGFYLYGDPTCKVGWCGVTNMGAWSPEVYLFKYTRNNIEYVAVGFKGSCYFLQLQVDLQDEMGKFGNIELNSNYWSWSFLTTTGTIPAADGGTTCVQVPYKADILNPSKVNGHTVNSDVPANAKFTDTVPTATQSKATGITASTTATKTTLGTAFTIPNVTSAGSASTWAFEDIACDDITSWSAGSGSASISGAVDSSDSTQLNITISHTHTAPTLQYTARTVSSKKSGANGSAPTLGTAFTVPNVTGNTSATVSVTDPGHTHSI